MVHGASSDLYVCYSNVLYENGAWSRERLSSRSVSKLVLDDHVYLGDKVVKCKLFHFEKFRTLLCRIVTIDSLRNHVGTDNQDVKNLHI